METSANQFDQPSRVLKHVFDFHFQAYLSILGWIKYHYYLFKKFLVSDWLTANCEIVISTQWRTKSGFFTFILAKWRQRANMKKIWTRLRHITMTTRIILTRWRHWYDDDDCWRTKELFFFSIQIKYKWLLPLKGLQTLAKPKFKNCWKIKIR
jgi:hypothetical protein